MRERVLRIESPLGNLDLRHVQATDKPADIGMADLILLGVMLWDTASAAAALRPLVGAQTAAVSSQHGVVKDDILRQVLGERCVVGGVCYIAATIAEPGVIRHTGNMQKLVFGEYDGSTSERLERFRDACAAAGIDHKLSSRVSATESPRPAISPSPTSCRCTARAGRRERAASRKVEAAVSPRACDEALRSAFGFARSEGRTAELEFVGQRIT